MVAILLYTLAGFFLAPLLIKNAIIDTVDERLDRNASVEAVKVNPYVLSVRINGFLLQDMDKETLASFDEFFVNFQLSSLFNWAWTFREIRMDEPYLFFERFSPGESRISAAFEDWQNSAEAETESSEAESGLPRLLVHQLALNQGSSSFRDHVPSSPVEIKAGPVTVAVYELNTLPDRSGQQSVSVKFPGGAALTWEGSLNLAPLHSEGTLSVNNVPLDPAAEYLKDSLPLDTLQATLSSQTAYRVQEQADGTFVAELSDMQAVLADFSLNGLSPSTELLAFPALRVTGGVLSYPEQSLHISSVILEQPVLDTWLDQAGQVNLSSLVPESAESEASGSSGTSSWSLAIDTFSLEGGSVAFADHRFEPQDQLELQQLNLTLTGISNQQDNRMPLSVSTSLDRGGQLGFQGQLAILPGIALDGTATLKDVPLKLLQPYVAQQADIRIEDGNLASVTEVAFHPDVTVSIEGEATISSLGVVDTRDDQPLLAWSALDIDRFEVDALKQAVHFSLLSFKQPYGRMHINEDRSTNLGGLLKAKTDSAAESDPAEPWSVLVGGIGVSDGSLDFSDMSLPLPFATRISDLDGTVSTIDSASTEPANIRLEGQVDEFGLARIEGAISVLDPIANTDVSVEFRNLLMSDLSPYSAQFAGREIDEGKLDLDLQYVINGGQLAGQNAVVLSDLVLGAEVDSPDAVSLPLGLAVALLKDSDGIIDIDLPVEGDINDPEFKIGGVIWKAFAGLITKIVSAPFRLLGNLIGIDSEDFGQFQYLAGRSDLTPPELEKIGQLQQALQKRPEITVEISGVYDPLVDTPVLKFFRLRDTVMERIGRAPGDRDDEIEMLDVEIRETLETLIQERFPDISLDTVKSAHLRPPASDPEGKATLDELAYAGDLRDRLLDFEEITEQDLTALAAARAQAVYDAFLVDGLLDAARLSLADPAVVESEDGEWVVMELGVAVD